MLAQLDRARFGPWALITGASSGIGREFARQIAASGINVVLVARREALLREAGAEFSKLYGVEHRAVVADLAEEEFLSRLALATDDLDIGLVISNAGTANAGEFLRLDRDELVRLLKLNSLAHMEIAHYFGRRLLQRRRGGILLCGAMARYKASRTWRTNLEPSPMCRALAKRCMWNCPRLGSTSAYSS